MSENSLSPADIVSVILQRIWSVTTPTALRTRKLLVSVLTLLVLPQLHSRVERGRTENAKSECFFLVSNRRICLRMLFCYVTFQGIATFKFLITKVAWLNILIFRLNWLLTYFGFRFWIFCRFVQPTVRLMHVSHVLLQTNRPVEVFITDDTHVWCIHRICDFVYGLIFNWKSL